MDLFKMIKSDQTDPANSDYRPKEISLENYKTCNKYFTNSNINKKSLANVYTPYISYMQFMLPMKF